VRRSQHLAAADIDPLVTGASLAALTVPREDNVASLRALERVGLKKMAVAAISAEDDSESLAMSMASNVQAEVDDRVSNHPVMLACKVAGIESVVDLQRALEMRDYGNKALEDLREDARNQAVRAFGAEQASQISAPVASMGAVAVKLHRDSWQAHADGLYGHAQDGTPPARVTAPPALVESVNATGDLAAGVAKSKWDQLDPAQQKTGEAMLGKNAKNPASREAFTVAFLEAKGSK